MKGNKSRRSVANDRINSFLNNKSVGIKAIKISEAGNIEIKFIAWCLSAARLKLRVNLITLTFTFEQYGSRYQQGIHNVAAKRKAIDTAINGDKNFFETEMIAFLEANMMANQKTDHERFEEMYMGRWDALKPEPISEVPDYVRYAAEAMTKTHGTTGIWGREMQLHSQEHEQLRRERRVDILKAMHARGSTVEEFKESAQQQYEQLQRERDGTPLFTDEQLEHVLHTNNSQKCNTLPLELNTSYPDLDIIEERTTTGEVKYCVAAKKLTDEEVKYLFDDAQRPYNNKLHEIMDKVSADGSVTISIDQSDADKVMLDIIDDTTKSVCDVVRAEIKKSKGDR